MIRDTIRKMENQMEKSMQLDPHGGRYDIRPGGGVLYVRELENRQLALLRSALASYSVMLCIPAAKVCYLMKPQTHHRRTRMKPLAGTGCFFFIPPRSHSKLEKIGEDPDPGQKFVFWGLNVDPLLITTPSLLGIKIRILILRP